MEESKASKSCSEKQAQLDMAALQQQCHRQLLKLNHELSCFFFNELENKIGKVLPSISTLNDEICQLQENINREVTQQQCKSNKQKLLSTKNRLLRQIQTHSKQINAMKKKMSILNINLDELMHQFQENQSVIENKELDGQSLVSKSMHFDKQLRNVLQEQSLAQIAQMNKSKGKRIDVKDKANSQSEMRWAQIDRIFDKISMLSSNPLSHVLVTLAKGEGSTIKTVFRDYKPNQKMEEFAKTSKVKRQLGILKKTISRQ